MNATQVRTINLYFRPEQKPSWKMIKKIKDSWDELEILTLAGNLKDTFFYFQINNTSNHLPVNLLSNWTGTDGPRHLDVVSFSKNSRIGLFDCVGVVGELDFERAVPAANCVQFTCNCLSGLNRNVIRSGALSGLEFAADLKLSLIKIWSSCD